MATLDLGRPSTGDRRLDESAYPWWRDHFSAALRRQMIDDDLLAGYSVPILLASLVAAGLTLAVVVVLATW
jgi:hypothetical protein